jgi:hypothetical protein
MNLTLKPSLTLVQPYPFLGKTIKEHYLNELEDKTAKHIYFYYEDETGKRFMKQVPYLDAEVLIDSIESTNEM